MEGKARSGKGKLTREDGTEEIRDEGRKLVLIMVMDAWTGVLRTEFGLILESEPGCIPKHG